MRRLVLPIAFLALVALGSAACSSNSNVSGSPVAETAPAADTPAADTLAPDTGGTLGSAGDCTGVPDKAALEAIVGVSLLEGDSSSPEQCDFRGADDSDNLVELIAITDPAAAASLEALGPDSLGDVVAIDDPARPGAKTQFGSTLFAKDGTLYTVGVVLVGSDDTVTTPLAVEVMKLWVGP